VPGENVPQPQDASALDAKIARLDTEIKRLDQLRSSDLETVAATLAAAKETVVSAQLSMDKRLDQMNEFRDQLREQASTFVRSDTLNAFMTERRQALETMDSTFDKRYEELRNLIAIEREERKGNEGIKRGMGQTTTIIVAAIGLVGTVLGIVIILSNVLTGLP
jgi:biopolymer transport protein ExbB/TolQ